MAGGSSSGGRGRIWLLPEYADDYRHLRVSDPKEYYAGLRREWAFRVNEAEIVVEQLRELGAPIVRRLALSMQRNNRSEYERAVKRIREENNRMFIRRSRYYMLKLANNQATAMRQTLTQAEVHNVVNNPAYISDNEMSDED